MHAKYRVLKWWRHKNEILKYLWAFTNCLEEPFQIKFTCKISALYCIKQLRYGLLHSKLSYLVLVPEVRNRPQIREVSMGLCKTSLSLLSLMQAIWKFGKWWRHTVLYTRNAKKFAQAPHGQVIFYTVWCLYSRFSYSTFYKKIFFFYNFERQTQAITQLQKSGINI